MIGKEDAAADSAVLWLEMVFIPRVFHRGTGAMRYALWDGDLWMDMDGYNPSKGVRVSSIQKEVLNLKP